MTNYAHYPERARGFDCRYWEVEKRLPLLIHLPGDAAAGVRSDSAGHLDIAPTVLSLPPSATIPSTQCRNLRTGEALVPAEMGERLREARVRLEMSDIILAGDLIPWASGLAGRSTRRADTLSASGAPPPVVP
jgi:hypothetical protein